jgi:hypothetical protein
MSLLREIQDAAIATDQPLATLLRRAKVLAARLDNPLLGEWVDHELNGYPDDATLPPYRARRPVLVVGDFSGLRWKADRSPISALAVPPEYRNGPLFYFQFTEPVAVYEELLRTEPADFTEPWPSEALALLQQPEPWPCTPAITACVGAWRVLPRGDVIAVVDGVRNRLLDLVLELERTAPEAGDVPASELPVSGEQVTKLITNTIYGKATFVTDNSIHVDGTAGNIASGQGNLVRQGDARIIQQAADLSALLGNLRAALKQLELDGRLPTEQLEATQGLVEDLEEEAAAPEPMRTRMVRSLKAITAIAGAAGQAGVGVVDAVKAIHHTLGS